jgi:hypothetical protein
MRKAAVALCIFIFLFLALTLVMLMVISKHARERQREKQIGAPAAPEEPAHSAEDGKAAELLENRALAHVLGGEWDDLDALSLEAAEAARGVRAVLMESWDSHDKEDRLVALAGLLRVSIERAGKDAAAIHKRMRNNLLALGSPGRPLPACRVAIRALAAFPEQVSGADLADLYGRHLGRFRTKEDPAVCAAAALMLAEIHALRPQPDFPEHRTKYLLPKLRLFESSQEVEDAIRALRR